MTQKNLDASTMVRGELNQKLQIDTNWDQNLLLEIEEKKEERKRKNKRRANNLKLFPIFSQCCL